MTAQKYRKRPVVIEAMHYNGSNDHDINQWLTTVLHKDEGGRLLIQTLEGTMAADPGDWIIRGVQHEVYPCKPSIFAATYERVEPT